MDRDEAFRNHYGAFIIVGYVLVTAMVIFFLNLSLLFQISLLIVSAIVFAWMLRPAGGADIPCGGSLEERALAEPLVGYDNMGESRAFEGTRDATKAPEETGARPAKQRR